MTDLKYVSRWALVSVVSLAGLAATQNNAPGGSGASPATTRSASTQVTLPNPHRYAEAMRRFAEDDAKAMPAAGGIVFVGSSTVRGWKVAEAFPDLPTINRGFGGSHTGDSVFWFDRVVLKYRPKVVVMLVGSNDLDSNRPGSLVVDNVRRFAEMLRATLPETKLIYVAVKPSPSRPDKLGLTIEVNEKIAEVAKEMGFTFVNPNAGLVDAEGNPKPELYVGDKLHFTPAGFAVINAAVEPVLRRVWAEANAK